ncbi:sigma factor, partial [Parabacteroides distasonis]
MKDAFSDENMFSEIYREYKARFIYFAWTYVRDEFIAEDLVVESFMYYWENRRTLVNQLNIPAYILTVIKNKCLN